MNISKITEKNELRESVDFFRMDANRKLDPVVRSALGQFMTPPSVANFMASLFENFPKEMSLLDPGAGVGSLSSALVHQIVERSDKPEKINLSAFEVDPVMLSYLQVTLGICEKSAGENSIDLTKHILTDDFIEWGVHALKGDDRQDNFTHCIINPPYKKIRNDSLHRALLREVGMETSNLYTAFLTVAIKLLAKNGEMVAIIPRSFCNGVYFRLFRKFLVAETSLDHIHVFESRKTAFSEDDVLQENIILYITKGKKQGAVTITSSSDSHFLDMTTRQVDFAHVINPQDKDHVIHIATSEADQKVINGMAAMPCTLKETGLEVCTGPVVDFRLRDDIEQHHREGLCPLVYPGHFDGHKISWPKPEGKKPNAIVRSGKTEKWLMENGCYVLTKRFSAKEEKRRIVAALHTAKNVPGEKVGFENHLNIFHMQKEGLDPDLAKGLTLYLNSSLVDLYFRLFSGHTQVNASDLRMLRYPPPDKLKALGKLAKDKRRSQKEIDTLLEKNIYMTKNDNGALMDGQEKIDQALKILKAVGMPRAQINERSALTLLALLDLKPEHSWASGQAPLIGITPIMTFCKESYGKNYAPNTRETFRRQTMHQFMEAGLAVSNPDKPDRPVNSPKWVYQIAPHALELMQSYGSERWDKMLKNYLKNRKTLAAQYAKVRDMQRIPVVINGGKKLTLTAGIHSQLIKDILEQFGSRFAPGAEVLYVGDTGSKLGHFDKKGFEVLGLTFDTHGKFPDVVFHFKQKNWLLLVESVTSHGPMDGKRHGELAKLFEDSRAGLVYITAFPDRPTMAKHLSTISWETEVWVADAPTHLIHFNGERFLGPYE